MYRPISILNTDINTNKQNPTTYKNDYIPWLRGIYHKNKVGLTYKNQSISIYNGTEQF